VKRFDRRGIFVPFFGFLPLFVSFGHDYGAVHTELIVGVVNGNDAATLSFLLSHMSERTGFDVSMYALVTRHGGAWVQLWSSNRDTPRCRGRYRV